MYERIRLIIIRREATMKNSKSFLCMGGVFLVVLVCLMLTLTPAGSSASMASSISNATFTTLKLGTAATASITTMGYQYFFEYTAASSEPYTFSSSSGTPVYGRFYDGNKDSYSASGSGSSSDPDFSFDIELTAGKTYYFSVGFISGSKTGSFTVTLKKKATSGLCGAGLTWELENNILTVSGTGVMDDYNHFNCAPWYLFSEDIAGVEIQSGVTGIGSFAFYQCPALYVNFPSGLTSIGEFAFQDCNLLKKIVLPNTVTTIGRYAFEGCVSLESFNIPTKLTSIGEAAFGSCMSAESDLVIPGGVTTLSDKVFFHCYSIRSVKLSSGVISIGKNTFDYCYGMTKITLPASVTSIGEEAFANCDGLTAVSYGGTASQWTAISISRGNGWLRYRKGDETLDSGTLGSLNWTISQNAKLMISGSGAMPDFAAVNSLGQVVGSSAPWDCYKMLIRSVEISGSVTTVGDYAFVLFKNAASIQIPGSVTSLGRYAFYRSGFSAVGIPSGLTAARDFCFADTKNLMEVDFPQGFTTFGQYVFYSSSLRDISIPVSLTSIPEKVFYGGNYLTNVKYAGTSTQWKNITIGSGNDPLIQATIHYNGGTGNTSSGTCGSGVSWTLNSSGVLTISGTGAMKDYTLQHDTNAVVNGNTGYEMGYSSNAPWYPQVWKIKKIVVSSGVTHIGSAAFFNCYNAASVSIPGTVTSIGDYAFRYMNITSVTVPKSVTSLGKGTFYGCYQLASVNLNASIKTVPDYCFDYCEQLKELVLPSGVTRIGEGAFGSSGIEDLTIPATVTSVSEDMGLRSGTSHHHIIRMQGAVPDGFPTYMLIGSDVYCKSQYYDSYKNYLLPDVLKITGSRFADVDVGVLCEGDTPVNLGTRFIQVNEHNMNAQLTATVGGSSDGVTTSWYSSDTSLMTVSSSGKITLKGTSGSAIVYAEATCQGYKSMAFCGVSFLHTQTNSQILATLPTSGIKANYIATSSTSYSNMYSGTSAYLPRMYVETDKSSQYYQELSSLVSSLTLGCADNREKTAKILEWVRTNVTYSSPPLCINESPAQAYEVFYNHIGNCQGFTKLAGFMLSIARIPSGVAVNNGHMWNVVYLDGKWEMLDAQHGSYAFYNNYNRSLYSGIKNIIFTQGNNIYLTDQPGEIKLIGVGISPNREDRTKITSVTIPGYVTSIFGGALEYCDKLTSITIPRTVCFISDDAFYGCTNLVIRCYKRSAAHAYAMENNISYTLLDGPEQVMTLPAELTTIQSEAFAGLNSADRIVIPASVNSIAENAFTGTDAILTVTPGSYAEQWAVAHKKYYTTH